jgi:hypothetical protein
MVPKAGVEPASPYEDRILSPACMPIPPLGHESAAYTHSDLALVNQMDVTGQVDVGEWILFGMRGSMVVTGRYERAVRRADRPGVGDARAPR